MMRAVALAVGVMVVLGLAGCGKRNAPSPPGPPDQVIYPRTYPAY